MGHVRLGTLPKTRAWREVVAILDGGGDAATVAAAASKAGIAGLRTAMSDPGMVAALWMLVQLPSAGREDDLVGALRERGVNVAAAPTLLGLTSAISEALDLQLRGVRKSDVSEMATLAAVETVTSFLAARVPSLFEATPADVKSALGGLSTERQFGAFARGFFARFTERYLAYYLSRELSSHVGQGQRFGGLDEHSAFNAALRVHCNEAARIVEVFAGAWFSKATWRENLSKTNTRRFAAVAFKKLNAELLLREGSPTRAR